MEDAEIQITEDDRQALQDILASGSDLYRGYDLILRYLDEGSSRHFWFKQASTVNQRVQGIEVPENDNLASQYIIAHTLYGSALDGENVNVNNTSNSIASLVLDSIADEGSVPSLEVLLQNDVAGAVDIGGQSIGGWGGSFYYWDLKLGNKTIGETISSSGAEYEKFILSSAFATVSVLRQELSEVEFSFEGLVNSYEEASRILGVAIDAQVPHFTTGAEIRRHALRELFTDGNLTDSFVFGPWTYSPFFDRFLIYENNSIIVANDEEEAFLRERLEYRKRAAENGLGDVDKLLEEFAVFGIKGGASIEDKCFPAGTLITLSDGSVKPIEEIEVGTKVAAYVTLSNSAPYRDGSAAPALDLIPKIDLPLRSAIVTDLIRNSNQELIEVNGVRVTPGHRFLCGDGEFREIGSLAVGDFLVDADGTPVPIREIKPVPGLHDTYNFTTAGDHTYIAAGYRVHNDSLFFPQSDEGRLADDVLDKISALVFSDDPVKDVLVGSAVRAFASVVADATFADENPTPDVLLGRYATNILEGASGYASRDVANALAEELGLPDNAAGALAVFAVEAGSEAAQLAALTLISEAAPYGSALQVEATQALQATNPDGTPRFAPELFLNSAAFAAIGTFVGRELSDLLDNDELTPFVSATAGQVIQQIGQNILFDLPVLNGITTVGLNAFGTVAGSYLANKIGDFDTESELLGSAIGSTIGIALAGSGLAAAFAGGFVGGAIGGIIGGAVGGDEPKGFAEVQFDPATDSFFIARVYGEDDQAQDVARTIAQSAVDTQNAVLTRIDGEVIEPQSIGTVVYGYDDGEFTYEANGTVTNYGREADRLINTGVSESLAQTQIAGGDVEAKRALALSLERIVKLPLPDQPTPHAVGLAEKLDAVGESSARSKLDEEDFVPVTSAISFILNNLSLSDDLHTYQGNQEVINAQLAAAPDSEFARGWQLSLAQAYTIGLQRRLESDWTGGWVHWLRQQSVNAEDLEFQLFDAERVSVIDTGSRIEVVSDTVQKHEKDIIRGDAASDTLIVDHDTFSRASSTNGQAGSFVGFNGFDFGEDVNIGFAANLYGDAGHDEVIGGDLGNDLAGGEGDDKLVGGALDDWLQGDEGNDVILANAGNGNLLSGGEGDDRLIGSDGSDWLQGGDGADTLHGGAGDDVLHGGTGADQKDGGTGDDIYLYRLGDGIDHIADSGAGRADVLRFGAGIGPDLLQVAAVGNGRDVVITFGADYPDDSIVLTGILSNGGQGIDRFQFADGTSWDRGQLLAALDGMTAGLTIAGTAADEALTGSFAGDTYHFNLGDGADTIAEAGSHLAIDRVQFGTGITKDNITFTRDLNDPTQLVIGIEGADDTLTVKTRSDGGVDQGIEEFLFQDGTGLTVSEINRIYLAANSNSDPNVVVGFDSNETISTSSGNDTLAGNRGNDIIISGRGNDTILFSRGDGWDVIKPNVFRSGRDILKFGDGISPDDLHLSTLPDSPSTLVIRIPGSGDRIELYEQFRVVNRPTVAEIHFSDGTVWTHEQIFARYQATSVSVGNDSHYGSAQSDILNGGDGHDRVHGRDGDDTLAGGAGDDTLDGGRGKDTFTYGLGDGNDVIIESSIYQDSDVLEFGPGIEAADISVTQDWFRGKDLRLTVSDGGSVSLLNFGSNNSIETVRFADGSEWTLEQIRDQVRNNWNSNFATNILGFDSNDQINAGAGGDYARGFEGEDTLTGGTGDDTLDGGRDNDTYHYSLGDGNDVIADNHLGGDGDRLILDNGIAPEDLTVQQDLSHGHDIRLAFSDGHGVTFLNMGLADNNGVEAVEFSNGVILNREQIFDHIRATWNQAGGTDIKGFGSADVIHAGDGDDRISAAGGDDSITGGTGDDVLQGGSGSDRYSYALGDGRDALIESSSPSGDADRLVLAAGISPDAVSVSYHPADANSLYLNFSDGGWILLKDQLAGHRRGVETIEFADGTIWTNSDLTAKATTTGSTLTGTDADETLEGGSGDDYVHGGDGSDTYRFDLGSGRDVFVGGQVNLDSVDTVELGGINKADVRFVRDVQDKDAIILRIAGSRDQLSIKNVEQVVFDDQTVWTIDHIRQAYVNSISSSGDDYVESFDTGVVIDTQAGNDRIIAGDGNDTIQGGTGNDYVEGGHGEDVYVFNRGDGRDIFEGDPSHLYYSDSLKFGAGIQQSDIRLVRNATDENGGQDAILGGFITLQIVGTQDQISINRVDYVEFEDGTVWTVQEIHQAYVDSISTDQNDRIEAYHLAEVIDGGAGHDEIYGGDGNDTLRGNAGDDYVEGGAGDDTYIFNLGDGRDVFRGNPSVNPQHDVVRFGTGIQPKDIYVRRDETDAESLVLQIAGTNDQVSVRVIRQVEFDDGTVWSLHDLEQRYLVQNATTGDDKLGGFDGGDVINAGAGNDNIEGGEGDDVIQGGAGDDIIEAGFGDDRIQFRFGDGDDKVDGSFGHDTLEFGPGITLSDIRVSAHPTAQDHITLEIVGTDDRVSIRRVESLQFSDGQTVAVADLILEERLSSSTDQVERTGSSTDDLLLGTAGDDVLAGRTGQDILVGGAGSDEYIFTLGDGFDIIREGADGNAIDRVLFGADITPDMVTIVRTSAGQPDVRINIGGDGDTLLLRGQLDQNGSGIEMIRFADGTEWNATAITTMADATPAGALVSGGTGDDTLNAAPGNQTLLGGYGADTYQFNLGDGRDIIDEIGGSGGNNILIFGTGIVAAALTFQRDSDDLIVNVNDDDQVTIKGQFSNSGAGIDHIVFDDSTILDRTALTAHVLSALTDDSDRQIIGTDADDVLDGGAGNDTLDGSDGSDTYQVNLASGHEHIADRGRDQGTDVLSLASGIAPADIQVTRGSTGAYSLTTAAGTWSVTLQALPGQTLGGIERIDFSDGTQWTVADVAARYAATAAAGNDGAIYGDNSDEALTGSATGEAIFGRGGADHLHGADGDDQLYGGSGNDTLQGGGGDDVLQGGLGRDSFDGGSGSDTLSVAYSTAGWNINLGAGTAATRANPDAAETVTNIENIQGSAFADKLTGSTLNNELVGGEGSDTYHVGAGGGEDTIRDAGGADGDVDTIQIDDSIAAADIEISAHGDDGLRIILGDGGDSLILEGMRGAEAHHIEAITFTDGTIWDRQTLLAQWQSDQTAASASHAGSGGMDHIRGSGEDDILIGRAGHDTLEGGDGSDTYLYRRGDGFDTLIETAQADAADQLKLQDLNQADIHLERDGDDLMIVVNDSGETVTVQSHFLSDAHGIQALVFADGSQFSRADLLAQAAAPQNSVITGNASAEVIGGGRGDDTLHGKDGSDTYIFTRGDGRDKIDDNGYKDTDKLIIRGYDLADVKFVRLGKDDMIIEFTGTDDQIWVVNALEAKKSDQIEEYHFDDGTVMNADDVRTTLIQQAQTAGADSVIAFKTDDTLTGSLGNDSIQGKDGSDSYIFARGDGQDRIEDNAYNGNSDADKLVIKGYDVADVRFERLGQDDMLIKFADSEDQIWVVNALEAKADDQIEAFHFDDGTIMSIDEVRTTLLQQAQGDGDDSVIGFKTNDTLTGSLGDDTLQGKDGSDTYIFTRGQGQDRIEDNGNGDLDRIQIQGYTVEETQFTRLGWDDMMITFTGTNDQIWVVNALDYKADDQIESFQFDDGTVLTIDQVRTTILSRAQTDGNDNLRGFSQDDILDGGLGNDTLDGEAGNDQFIFRADFGHDTIKDFTAGADSDDVITFNGVTGFEKFADVVNAAADDGTDTTITKDANNSVTLKNVKVTDLDEDDFSFL